MGRRAFLRLALLAFALVGGTLHADQDVLVPVQLQVELLTKVAAYDKNLPSRARQGIRLLIVSRSGNAAASRVAQQAARALEGKSIVGQPVVVSQADFVSGAELARRVKDDGIAILYLTPGFEAGELKAISASLAGSSVLSAGAVASFVRDGVVLSFDLVSGKPKLLVHVRRARDQKVELSSYVLKLVKVVE
jgi:hypothetical protein